MPKELILTFHGLGEPPAAASEAERDVWVPVAWFEAIVDALPAHGVGLAFDDGNASDLHYGLHALLERNRSARFFVLAGELGSPGRLSCEQLAELHAAGMAIGSHGLHHRDWRTLTQGELERELVLSRRTLEDLLGEEVGEAAVPFGSYDRRVLRALRRAHYRRVFNSDGGSGPVGSWLMPRTTVHLGRPLQHWLDLVSASSNGRPTPTMRGKRLLKRLR